MSKRSSGLSPLVAAAIVLIAVTGGSTFAMASAITYTVSDTASGTLGATSFTGALVTVSFSGDTGTVFMSSAGFWENDIGTATVTIAGIGTATFTDAMFAFDNQAAIAAGIGDNTCVGCRASVLDTFNSVFGSYDLMSAIGPISGAVFFRPDLSYGTTMGLLNFSSAGATSTFTATTVPEPANLILLGTGLVSLIGFVRRRMS
jgi:hypothetical protein